MKHDSQSSPMIDKEGSPFPFSLSFYFPLLNTLSKLEPGQRKTFLVYPLLPGDNARASETRV